MPEMHAIMGNQRFVKNQDKNAKNVLHFGNISVQNSKKNRSSITENAMQHSKKATQLYSFSVEDNGQILNPSSTIPPKS